MQVITLKQLPVIEEHLQLVKADVETRTKMRCSLYVPKKHAAM